MGAIWGYRSGSCGVTLAFFPEVGSAIERVLSVEVKDATSAGDCLSRLSSNKAKP
jgi:hypothetical protein